ncbi:HIT family protein [Actinomadura xylanilytica]|uniref:HIT family protein n=1 Tax=Actinomadura xylanilytica TaxID=887459 RepID=UPI00255B3EDA|nr:HIT family protein [Actinomadura xylanilytica]MDL4771622.1 HIT family protein [Actinomadura xylanilytica]
MTESVKGCVFCEIARGERPAHIVLDAPDAFAFLDARPLFKGHTLLVPRDHYATLSDLPVELVGPFFEHARRLSGAMESGLGAAGSFVAMNNRISQSVPHLHVHVVPRERKDGLRGFFWPRHKYHSDEEAADYAARLSAALAPEPESGQAPECGSGHTSAPGPGLAPGA